MQIITQDSTITLYSKEFDENYHSTSDGALKETLHKHILPALEMCWNLKKEKICVLDICFGLGFNTLALVAELKKRGFKGEVEIHSPEMNMALVKQLLHHPYPKELESLKEILEKLVESQFFYKDNLKIFLHFGNAREILKSFECDKFDVIFQDAFSPLKNPILWTFEYFKMLYKISKKEVLITTYSQNSSTLYSAFLAGFYAFKLKQNSVRDSVILCKDSKIPPLNCKNIKNISLIDMEHKIKVNKNLKAMFD